MNKSKLALAIFGVLVLLIGGRIIYGLLTRPDDQTLIAQALDESIEASKEGRPGGVLDLLSEELKLNEQQVGTKRQIADYIRRFRPEVTVENKKALVTGDE